MALSPADFSLALKSDFMATDSHDRVKRAGVWILTTSLYTGGHRYHSGLSYGTSKEYMFFSSFYENSLFFWRTAS